MTQLALFGPKRKVKARKTSLAAYDSVKTEISKLQDAILHRLIADGPQTDTMISMHYKFAKVSGSSLRSRRAELVALGKVTDSGKRVTLPSGRQSIVWKAVR